MSVSNKHPFAGSRSPARSKTDLDASRRTRMGLLGSTALIAASLAAAPALAQVVVGGGSITHTNGTASSNAPGGADGVSITGGSATQVTINNVIILNATGVPTADAVRLEATSGVAFTGSNSLRTNVSGGSGLYVQSNANLGIDLSASDNTFQGSYGIRASAAGGFINFNSVGRTQTITGNGTALIGIDVAALLHPEVYFGTSVVSGFATGVQLTQSQTTGLYVLFSSTGGSITATGTGIRADAFNGTATVNSQTAITAPIGIHATGANVAITTSGGGTINGATTGIQANAALVGNTTTITVGAAIGGSQRPTAGVSIIGTGVVGGLNTINANANISSSGSHAIGSNFSNTDLTVNVANGVTVTSSGGFRTIGAGRHITLNNSGTITNTSANGSVIGNSQGPSTIAVTNSGTISANAEGIAAAATANVVNSGTISSVNAQAIRTGRGGTITNNVGGVISGGSSGTAGWGIWFDSSAFSAGQTVNNNATINGGGAGSIFIDAVTASALNLNAGSNTNGLISVTGSGTVTTTLAGTLTGTYSASGTTGTDNLTVASTGVLTGGASGVGSTRILNLTNAGSITGTADGVNVSGGGVLGLTNASGGTITGATASVRADTSGAAVIDLQAGSTTNGSIVLSGTGARTVTLAGVFNGSLNATGNSGAVNLILNTSATGYSLLDGGSGADSLTFTGSGSRTFSVDELLSWDTGAFTGGAWTLTGTGNQTSFTSGLTINGAAVTISNTQQLQGSTGLTMTGGGSITTTASLINTRTINLTGAGSLGVASGQTLTQSGVISGAGALTLNGPGTLILSGTNTYTGGTVVNSGILRLNNTSAAGAGVIRMLDPQINFAATGTYANAISLEVANGQQAADPTILNNISGGAITLSGRIYETAGVGGAGQYVTLRGGSITLSNDTNSWGGVTTIDSGASVLGTTGSISGGSIVNNGTLTYQNVSAGTASQAISGSGAITINGTGATLAGAITTSGQLTISGAGSNLILAGARSGSSGTGAFFSATGGSLGVANGGSIVGGGQLGVHVTGVGSTLSNLGSITNSGTTNAIGASVYVQATSGTITVNNGSASDTGAGSIIRGYNAGIRHDLSTGGLLVVNNYGYIQGDIYNGIENSTGGLTVNNFNGGYIYTQVGNGISSNSGISVTNAGVIGQNFGGSQTVGSSGVNVGGPLTLNNQAGGLIIGQLNGVYAGAISGSNAGTIQSTSTGGDGALIFTGGSFTNAASGQITGAVHGVHNLGGVLTFSNAGAITGGSTTAFTSQGTLTLTNTGTISTATGAGVTLVAGGSVINSGTLTGGNNATVGYGVYNATNSGMTTITNQSGGVINGGVGAIHLAANGAANIDLQAGSTTTGQILSTGSGVHNVNIAGALNGTFNASTGTGVDNLTLAATGAMTSADLGAGADSFVYQGGAFSGVINAGSGVDSFTSAIGAGSASVNLTNLVDFETFAHQSGTLTLTGTRGFSGGASVTGGTLVVNGTLQTFASVASGATLSGGGTITSAVTVADGGVLANTQGATLTTGALTLSSGSLINATFSGAGGNALFAVDGALTLDGSVNVASTGAFGFGVYGLMTYTGALNNQGLLIGTRPGAAQRMDVQTSVAGQVNIVHAPNELLFWDGGNGAQHDNGAVNGGAGVWTAAGSEWTDANGLSNGAMEPQPGFAIFQGAGGTVTVDNSLGDVGVTGMQFAANGYRIEGDAIELANASTIVRVGNGTAPGAGWTATIASALTGAGGLVKTDLGTLILAGDSDYTGGTTVNAGTLQIGDGASAGSIDGSVVLANGASVTFARNDDHDFTNAVSGTGTVNVNGIVTLSGAITATNGVGVSAGSTATLSNVSIVNGNAVFGGLNSVVNLAAGGTIQSQNGTGVFLTGANGEVDNAGTIAAGSNGVFSNGGLTLTNQATGAINAVFAVTAVQNLDLTNDGVIAATNTAFNSSGIYAGGTGTISNTGTITSGSNAIYTQGAGALTNSGLIRGGGAASTVRLFGANSSVTNLAGGEITTTGTGAGLYLDGLGATVVNSGTIRGGNAVSFVSGGGSLTNYGVLIGTTASGVVGNGGTLIANLTGGTITGVTNGVNIVTGAGNLTNDGAITGASAQGVLLQAGGTITNTGDITGGQSGVRSLAALSLSTAGTISGSVNAIESVGAFNDNLTFLAGSTTGGAVLTNGGDDLISLAGALNGVLNTGDGADTVSLFDTASVSSILDGGDGVDAFVLDGSGNGSLDIGAVLNFESRAMNGAGVWTLTGTDVSTAGWNLLSGTLAVTGGSAINDAAGVTIGSGGSLALMDDETIAALSGSGFVDLGSSVLTLGGAQTSLYTGVISGFGDLVVGAGHGLTLTGANTYTGTTVVDGVLTLGASNVLADASSLLIGSGGSVDLQTFDEDIDSVFVEGVLNGSGTLTAFDYGLDGATVNANLGSGVLYNLGGVSTLNGLIGADLVSVDAGTLVLGASDRLADSAILGVALGATFDLGAFNETVDLAVLQGTLAGTGTLTGAFYGLADATVNANLGAGVLFNIDGASTLNGTSSANLVVVDGGTLRLGASNRIADAADLQILSGATFDIGAFDETVNLTAIEGTLSGGGTLTALEHQLDGATINANLAGASVHVVGGASILNGVSGADLLSVLGGSLTLGASDRIADAAILGVASGATLDIGAFDDTVAVAALSGTLAGTGTLTAGEYDLDGATVNANLGAGDLFNTGGVSILNGTTGAANVWVQAGTLTLGGSDRMADAAMVSVTSGATLNLGAFTDTVNLAVLNGTLAGAGTLTAARYALDGATINANLGAGELFNVAGVSTLTGASAAANVSVLAGTLAFGASNRLADTATVSVASGATLDVGAFNDAVNLAALNGTLAGTGRLTAAQYQLNAAAVNANLGAGTLFNLGGVSTVNGTAAASAVLINAGTLRLGANERLSDAASVSVASGATFNLNGFNERIGALFGTGDVSVGAGRLTFGGVESGFGGRLSGTGSVVHTGGLFTLLGNHSIASISNTGGELRFAGTTTGGISASGGSVTGAGTIGGALTASNGAVLSPGLAGVQNGIGGFTAGGLTLNGGTLAIDVLGQSGGNLIDQLRINGTATLTGGILAPTFHGTAATNFATRYLFLQANNLVGTFANGAAFTPATQEGVFWRVRYDLAPNAAVLELRQLISFDPGVSGTGNQRAIGQALSGGQLGASDDWAAVIGLIAGLSAAERAAAFDSISGEPLADVTTSMFSANNTFLTAVRDGGMGGRNDGGEALNFVGNLSFSGGRDNSADRLGDVLGAFDPSASTERGSGGWVSAYAGDQTLDGKPGQATVESKLNGFAGGYGVRHGSMSLGGAAGVTRVEGDVVARAGHYESDLSHAAGYVAFDDGVWAADVSASFYGGDLDTRRGIAVGAFTGTAIGNTHTEGQALSASVARRFQVSDNTMIALGAVATASNASVDGYTETGAGALSLQASGQERDWQSLQLSARGTQDYRVNGHGFRIYGGAGVMAMAGDRQATGDMRFTGAPVGFGTFVVEGAETPPLAGLVDFGVEVGASEGVTISAGYRGLFSERLQDNQIGVKLKVSW